MISRETANETECVFINVTPPPSIIDLPRSLCITVIVRWLMNELTLPTVVYLRVLFSNNSHQFSCSADLSNLSSMSAGGVSVVPVGFQTNTSPTMTSSDLQKQWWHLEEVCLFYNVSISPVHFPSFNYFDHFAEECVLCRFPLQQCLSFCIFPLKIICSFSDDDPRP